MSNHCVAGDVWWRWCFVPSTACAVYFCLTVLLFLLLKDEVDIPALSVESLLHLDLGSQGCPGPAGYHLNHTLISPPCTLCCWINNAISVKQPLLPSCSHLLSPSGFLSLSCSHFCKKKIAHLFSLLVRTLHWLTFIPWRLAITPATIPNPSNYPNLSVILTLTKNVESWPCNKLVTLWGPAFDCFCPDVRFLFPNPKRDNSPIVRTSFLFWDLFCPKNVTMWPNLDFFSPHGDCVQSDSVPTM